MRLNFTHKYCTHNIKILTIIKSDSIELLHVPVITEV